MSVRPEVKQLPAYQFTAKAHRVKLDQNESPYDLPPEVKAHAFELLSELDLKRYPEMHAESLREALADYHQWPEGIVISGGSNVLLQAIIIACGLGQRVLTVKPTFSVYALSAKLLKAELIEVALNDDFSLPLEALEHELRMGKGVFFLANPAAPTGNVFEAAEVEHLVACAKPNYTVVIDEAYQQFAGTDFSYLAQEHEHVLCLRTFSKAFGLAAVRLGYALCHVDLATQLQKCLLPFSVSSLQLAIGRAVLAHAAFLDERIASIKQEQQRVFASLSTLAGVTVYHSSTNFILFRTPDAAAFYQGLLAEGVLVRRQDHLHLLDNCLRVSIGTPEENEAFLYAARKVAQALQQGRSLQQEKEHHHD